MSGSGASSAITACIVAYVLLLQAALFPLPALADATGSRSAGAAGGNGLTGHSVLPAENHVSRTDPPGNGLLAMGEKSREPGVAPNGSGATDTGEDSAGGLFRSALEGSFLGALLFGYPFEDLGLPDLALLGLLGFLLVWRFMPGSRPGKKKEGDRFTVGRRDKSSTELPRELQPEDPGGAARKSSGQRAGRWPVSGPDNRKDGLPDREAESNPAGPERAPFRRRSGLSKDQSARAQKSMDAAAPARNPAGAPGASSTGEWNPDDFLEGARIFYIRMQEAWAERDTESLAPFMTPDMMRLLREQAAADPHPVSMRIMLLDATLAGLEQQDGEERAGVQFSVFMSTNHDAPVEIHEIWRFVRGRDTGGTWRLAGIEEHEKRP